MAYPTTLAELKRFMQTSPTLTLISAQSWNGQPHKFLNIPRTVEKTQTNAIKFSGGSWLEYEKAACYTFLGDTFTVDPSTEKVALHSLTYKIN